MTKPKRRSDYRLEEVDGEILLFNPASERILYCNPSAALVWRLCDGSRTVDEMTDLLAEAYPGSAEAMPEDVRNTLEELRRFGAIDFS